MGGRGVWVRGVKEEQRSAIAAATAGQCGSVHGSAATAGGGEGGREKGGNIKQTNENNTKKGGRERKRKQNQKESQPANVNAAATCQVKVLML